MTVKLPHLLVALGLAVALLASCGGRSTSQAGRHTTTLGFDAQVDRVQRRNERRLRADFAAQNAAQRVAVRKFERKLRGSSAVLAGSGACKYRGWGALPDHRCTPGATNPNVTQANIRQTICVSGWTDTVRPPQSVTEPEKVAGIAAYGARFGSNLRAYEYDHLVPLEVGGAPNDPRNMWPEPDSVLNGNGSFDKDAVENHVNAEVCNGKLTLAQGQAIFEKDWRTGR